MSIKNDNTPEEGEITAKEKENIPFKKIIEDMKKESNLQQDQNRKEMKNELQNQIKINNIELEKRLESQKKTMKNGTNA